VLIWLHVLAEVAMALAYVSVPAVLLLLLLRRRVLAFPWLIGLFAAFILAGGVTHLIGAFAVIQPSPIAEGLARTVAAAISVAFAAALWPLLPRLIALRSPATLALEVEERRAAEQRARESEARARESEARMAEFIANLSEALFVLRVTRAGEMLVETVNPAFERIFGVSADALAGRPAEAVMPPALVRPSLPHWREAISREQTQEYELTADLPTGRLTWETVLVPLRGPDGQVGRLLASARDVTATRRLQAGLVQSARLATIGTMCAGLAHEASQPLNIAGLWLRRARTVAQDLPSAQQAPLARAVTIIEDQLRRAGDLVARIRALAVDESRRAETFDPSDAVTAALQRAAAQYAPDGIVMRLEGAAEGALVRGNPARLQQAVLQLLANARDAVLERRLRDPAAPAHISVALRRDRGSIVVEVRDSGTGIPDAVREAIFDPFFTTKEPGRGTGFGLAFTASVARAMGGGIEACNLPEGGACLRMELAEATTSATLLAAHAAA
jgi:PAS domain S-box-containing protein